MTTSKKSRFEEFLKALELVDEKDFNKALVISMMIKHFEGHKLTCSPHIKIRMYREKLAYTLVCKGTPRNIIANMLTERLQISKQWAISLVNKAIVKRSAELHPLTRVSNVGEIWVKPNV